MNQEIFQEALDHCRWKTVLRNILKDIKPSISQYKNKTFEEIICEIHRICENVKGLGMLTMYDITSAICRYYNISINKVYIIGNGPKRAIKILNIKTKKHKIRNKLTLHYVDVENVIFAFNNKGYKLHDDIINTNNGDIIETYICKWQKSH